MQPESDVLNTLVAALRRYLADHPSACDTLQGLQAWWLPPEAAACSPGALRAAVALLVARGEMESSRGLDGQTVYRAPSAHRP